MPWLADCHDCPPSSDRKTPVLVAAYTRCGCFGSLTVLPTGPWAGNLPTWRHPQKQSMLRYGPSSVAAYSQPVFMLPGNVEFASPRTFARTVGQFLPLVA